MNVLITGGAGFIGSHIADQLLAAHHKILVIDNFKTARRDNLTSRPGLQIIEGTITDDSLVNRLFQEFKPEQVIHAAASYSDPNDWVSDAMTNVIGTINIVKAAQKANVKRLVYCQTSLCYGLSPLEQPITLKHPLFSGGNAGGSSYIISKTGGEQYIELSGLDFISFRLANGYGPRNLTGPLPVFFQRLTANKPCFVTDTRRDFVYIDDIVEVFIKAVNGQGNRGYYNISSGADCAIKELYDVTVKALGVKPEKDVEIRPRGPDDSPTLLLDPSKTNQDFNWKTVTTLEEGIKRSIDYYKKFGVTETFSHLKNAKDNQN